MTGSAFWKEAYGRVLFGDVPGSLSSPVEMFQKSVQAFPVVAAPGPYNVGVVPRGFGENPLPGLVRNFQHWRGPQQQLQKVELEKLSETF